MREGGGGGKEREYKAGKNSKGRIKERVNQIRLVEGRQI